MTLAILVPLGFALDFFFATHFFIFPNPGATLGIAAPALGHPVPIEEYAFYLLGFLTVLLLYIWLGEYWLVAYSVPPAHGTESAGEERALRRLLGFHPSSAIAGAALIAAGIAWKKLVSPMPDGFPGYYTFIVAGALVPSAILFRQRGA